MIISSPQCFSHLFILDLTRQSVTLQQVSALFSLNTTGLFPCLKSIAFRIAVDPPDDIRIPVAQTVPPVNLENMTVYLTCWRIGDFLSIGSLLPLFYKTRKLRYIVDKSRAGFFCRHGLAPFQNLVELEMADWEMGAFNGLDRDIREIFPQILRVTFKSTENDAVVGGFFTLYEGSALNISVDSIAEKEIHYETHSVEGSEIICQTVNATTFSWLLSCWDGSTDVFLDIFRLLEKCKCMQEVRLPREFLMAWSKYETFRSEFMAIARAVSFPTVQSLYFLANCQCGCLSSFSTPVIRNGEICDEALRHFFLIFPNVRTLSIVPVPYLEGGSLFRFLTSSTQLTKLMILHTRRLQSGRLDRRLEFRMWLPDCQTLDAFLLYTEQMNWRDEESEGGLLNCLMRNASLRYACIICDVASAVDYIGLTRSAVERIATAWYKRAESQGLYLVFVFLHRKRFYSMAVRPKTKKCRKPFAFEQNEFSTWWDLERVYPELYTIFWRDLSLSIDFRQRIVNI
ncbi:hypothetical protein Aperf_G00000036002 [Anoplocephala perfoliata]